MVRWWVLVHCGTGSVHVVVPAYMELTSVWAVIRKQNGPHAVIKAVLKIHSGSSQKKLNFKGRLYISCGYIIMVLNNKLKTIK
jgi:hypothetical protein